MCTEKYVDPFTDYGFKLLFGTPANKEFLIEFLNSILECKSPIVDISYNNTEVFGKSAEDRKAVFDLYCTTLDNTHIIVEMQNAYQRYFVDRTIYYSTFPMQAAAKRGEWSYRLPEIYTVAFLNFTMGEYFDNPHYKHVVRLMDVNTRQVFYNKLTYVYLEMPKFQKTESELKTAADFWMYAIKNMVYLDEKPAAFRDKVFTSFFHKAEIARFTPEQRTAYETSLKIMRDYNNTVTSALDKGFTQGKAEGLAEGVEKGKAQGRAEGLAEGKKAMALQIAASMKEAGISPYEIAKITGLTETEIKEM